jgi:hypothetical protein
VHGDWFNFFDNLPLKVGSATLPIGHVRTAHLFLERADSPRREPSRLDLVIPFLAIGFLFGG